MNVQKIEKAARNRLSEKRFRHTKGVADCAKKLADRYHADPDLAVVAGYLHDMEKIPLISISIRLPILYCFMSILIVVWIAN